MMAKAKGRKLLNKCMLSAIYAEPNFQLFAVENRFERSNFFGVHKEKFSSLSDEN